jgi:hypothetical protein
LLKIYGKSTTVEKKEIWDIGRMGLILHPTQFSWGIPTTATATATAMTRKSLPMIRANALLRREFWEEP